MCDERERVIGYLYDECDADERRAVDAHLEECSTCRDEVQALRQVRTDLLAWEVRGTPDVWRPSAAPAAIVWWKHVPAWALGAAAGLVIAAGLLGGVSARAFSIGVPEPVAVQATAPPLPSPSPAPVVIGLTRDDLAAVQERILALVRVELDQRALRPDLRRNVSYTGVVDDQALRQVRVLDQESQEMLKALAILYDENMKFKQTTEQRLQRLQEQVAVLNQLALNNGIAGAGGAGVQR
jgi:hypothetical protein